MSDPRQLAAALRYQEDRISPTPRNKLLGTVADSMKSVGDWTQSPERTQQMQGLSSGLGSMLGLLGLQRTLNEMSYGGALGTGKGMTWQPKADTVDAALAVAPLAYGAGKVAKRGVMAMAQDLIDNPRIPNMSNRQTGIFAGMQAKTADKASYNLASQRLDAGDDAAKVWRETGWGKGPDGKMRFEIPDNTSVFNDTAAIQAKNVAERDRINAAWQQSREISAGLKTQPDLFESKLRQTNAANRTNLNLAEVERNRLHGLTTDPQYRGNFAPVTYENKALYDAYPELKSTIIRQSGGNGAVKGMQSGKEIDIYRPSFEPTTLGARSTASHELQHSVQDLENFARGGNVEQMTREGLREKWAINDKITKINDQLKVKGNPNYNNLLDERQSLVDEITKKGLDDVQGTGYDRYRQLGGEAEARLTQARINMTPAQRRAEYPWEPGYFRGATGERLDSLINRFDSTGPQQAKLAEALKYLESTK